VHELVSAAAAQVRVCTHKLAPHTLAQASGSARVPQAGAPLHLDACFARVVGARNADDEQVSARARELIVACVSVITLHVG
jgi:hypothetical protein